MGWYLPKRGLICLSIPKNATNAIHQALVDNKIEHTKVHKNRIHSEYPNVEVVALWRDPVTRMESAYRMLRDSAGHCNNMQFADWVKYVCRDESGDRHIAQQWRRGMWGDGRGNVRWCPTRIVRWDFEEMRQVLGLEKPIAKVNPSRFYHTEWTQEAMGVFETSYWQDFYIWDGAKGPYW